MTALDEYIRLEAAGRWRETPDSAWREVLISFGNATLVLSNFSEEPLTHWSLAAVVLREKEGDKAVYAPDTGVDEFLEVTDPQMIDAIARVTARARHRGTPRPVVRQRLRGPVMWGLLVFLVVALVAFGPDYLRGRALALIPQDKADLLAQDIRRSLPAPCTLPEGRRAFSQLAKTVVPDRRVQVLNWDAPAVARLPDNSVILSRQIVETAATPEELAGWMALGATFDRQDGAIHAWVDKLPLDKVLRFLSTAEFQRSDIQQMVAFFKDADRPPTSAELEAVRATLSEHGIADGPFLTALGMEGGTAASTQLLTDQQWVAVQQICSD